MRSQLAADPTGRTQRSVPDDRFGKGWLSRLNPLSIKSAAAKPAISRQSGESSSILHTLEPLSVVGYLLDAEFEAI
jgi:hypothetical protein